jgi:hypothetical protein
MHTTTTPVRRPGPLGRSARWLGAAGAVLMLVGLAGPAQSVPAVTVQQAQTVSGTLPDGAAYQIQVPANWNGTLALYSHGLVFPGDDNPARAAFDGPFGEHLLAEGVALAGSAFSTGWAVEDALRDQRATVDEVTAHFGKPTAVIAYGDSLGGMISTALVEGHPEEFAGGLAMCGVQAGGIGAWNHFLDSAFVFKTLAAGSTPLRVTGIDDPVGNLSIATDAFQSALQTPQGRARLALAAAIAQIPGAIDPSGPVSAPSVQERFEARMGWMQAPYLTLTFAERGELEARAGGNPSWNTGVDYERQLRASGQRSDVRAMYKSAGADLDADLHALATAPRVEPDPAAVRYLERNVTFAGQLERPLLTLRNVADGALPSSHDRAYADAVAATGHSALLRQAFTGRPGHCTFTTAEAVVAFETVLRRVRTGAWGDTSPAALNDGARDLGPELNQGGGFPVPPAFVAHHPLQFPRPFVTH